MANFYFNSVTAVFPFQVMVAPPQKANRHYAQPMLAIARFTVALGDAAQFETDLTTALASFAECAGFIDGEFGQNLDDSTLWSLVTRWQNIGSYRRALSNNSVKMNAIPTLARAIDEPGAYARFI